MPETARVQQRGPAYEYVDQPEKKTKQKKKKSGFMRVLTWPARQLSKLLKSQVGTIVKHTGLKDAVSGGGNPAKYQQFPLLTEDQETLQNALIGTLRTLIEKQTGNKFDFAPIEKQAKERFRSETIPGILRQVVNLGGAEGGLRSSGLGAILGKEANKFETGLEALRSQYNLQQSGQQQDLLQSLIAPSLAHRYESLYNQRQPGFMEAFLPQAMGQAVKQGLKYGGAYLAGGPVGAGTVAASDIAQTASKVPRG